MPLLLVSPESELALLKRPESGMGYQVIQTGENRYVVFNATLAISLEELRETEFTTSQYQLLATKSDRPSSLRLKRLELDSDFELAYSSLDKTEPVSYFGLSRNEGTIRPPETLISRKRAYAYYRFSAFARDKRVNALTGEFLPGTYATTYNDIHHVPSGFAAVGRYALPNPASARHVHQLVTSTPPSLVGTAAPNFGQAGGGVEVLFKNGAKPATGGSFRIAAG